MLSLPTTTTLSKIRHVRIIDSTQFRFEEEFYNLGDFISHVPGLRLETLTILDDDTAIAFQHFVNCVKHSCGWRELRFVTDSTLLYTPKVT
jgi:hypothetical protein